jgi:protocatechuate 3,4-dioxygenase beta subunit
MRTTRTGSDGTYAFDAVAAGKYTVSVGPPDGVARGQSQAVEVGASGTVRADFQGNAAGTKTVTGTVRRGGQPVADASVLAIDSRGYDHMVTSATDGQGSFEASGVLPGRVSVRVETGDGASKTVTVTVPAEGEAAPVTIEFGSATVHGRVVDHAGKPVSGAWVSVEAPGEDNDWTRVVAQKTSLSDGTFRASAIGSGTYQVRVTHQGRAPLLSAAVRVAEGETVDVGTLTLQVGYALSGTVHDDAGRPVEDATVSMTDAAGRPLFLFSFATTGSDGRYRVQELQPGSYTLRVEARGYAPFTGPVRVEDGPVTADAVLIRGGEVRVTVEDEGGHPIQGARVTLVDSRGRTVTKTLSLVSLLDGNLGLTSEQGVALVPDLAAGAYRVRARKDGFQTLGDDPPALVPGGGSVQVRLIMRSAP